MLRYDENGRPVGLDWTVCNDGNPRPEVWSDWSPVMTKKPGTRRDIINPGSGKGSNTRLPIETEEKIVSLYVEKEMAAIQIAKELRTTAKTVFRVLQRNDIPTRTKTRAQQLRHANERAAQTTWEAMQ